MESANRGSPNISCIAGQRPHGDRAARHRRLENAIQEGGPAALAQSLEHLGPTAAADAVAFTGGRGGRSLWHAAVDAKDRRCIDALRRFGVEAIDARDDEGQTPLHRALGWEMAATKRLAPALELTRLDQRLERLDKEEDGNANRANKVLGWRIQCMDQLEAAVPEALDYLAERPSRAGVAEVVNALLRAGANPGLSLIAKLPPFSPAHSTGRSRQADETAAFLMWLLQTPPGGLMETFPMSDIDYSPLQVASILAAEEAIAPLFESLAARDITLSGQVTSLLETDWAVEGLASELPEGAGMARALARTHKRLMVELWNRVKRSPDSAQTIYNHLAERHDHKTLVGFIQAMEAQAVHDPERARRSVERPARGNSCLLHALLWHDVPPDLIGRTLRLGARATTPLHAASLDRFLLPMDLVTMFGAVSKWVEVQVLLEPRYRAWLSDGSSPGAGLQPALADQALADKCLAKLRKSPPNPAVIGLLLGAGATANHVCDLTISVDRHGLPLLTPGGPAAVSWPLRVSALDVCAISGAQEAAAVLLRHPSMKGQQQLIETAWSRAGIAKDRSMQQLIGSFLDRPDRRLQPAGEEAATGQ